jgi:hypothetical protein
MGDTSLLIMRRRRRVKGLCRRLGKYCIIVVKVIGTSPRLAKPPKLMMPGRIDMGTLDRYRHFEADIDR